MTTISDILWQAENEHLRVALYNDGSAVLIDSASGERWQTGRVALQEEGAVDVGHVWLRTERSICEQYTGRFRGERQGDALRFTLIGRLGREIAQFTVVPRLSGEWLELTLTDVGEGLDSLVYPPPIESESLVLPLNIGRWIREPLAGRHVWVYPAHLRQRWFGGLRGDAGWMAVFDQPADAGVLATGLMASPVWLSSMRGWTGERMIRYRLTTGGYVGMAKAFRQYAIERGLHVSLKEKMERFPALRSVVGGHLLGFFCAESYTAERYEDRLEAVPPDLPPPHENPRVYCTYRDVRDLITRAKARGARGGLAVVRGWIRGGYDETHPDILPPEPKLGSEDDLRALLHDSPLVALHDNYQDIYRQSPSFPHGVIVNRAGQLMPGGFWAGGQAYILNSCASLHYARRNWEHIQTWSPRAMFVDTTTAVQFYEDYAQPQSRSDDMRLKTELMRLYRDEGQVFGSEEGADFGVPYCDWFENRHTRIPGESIPLWPLVFHDAAFCARYSRPLNEWLPDMLWGYMLLWTFRSRGSEPTPNVPTGMFSGYPAWEELLDGIGATGHVAQWHGRIGTEAMVSHRFLTEDGQVEETEFETAAILCNFADEPRTVGRQTIAAGGYLIRD